MFTRMKRDIKTKGSELQKRSEPAILGSGPNEFLIKGLSLTNIQRSDPNRNARLQAEQGSPAGEGSDLIVFSPFSPSSKLSPGLSNQPKSPIYLFRQSQCQIANLPSIL